MSRVSPLLFLSFCLVSLTIGAMFAVEALVGSFPDQVRYVSESRQALCENLAVQYSVLASSGQLPTIETAMQALVQRNADILSAALLLSDGQLLAVAGDHVQHWVQPEGHRSTLSHIQVPIYNANAHWGTLQLSFRTTDSSVSDRLFLGPWPRFVASVALLSFVGYVMLLKRTLRHLDPSQVIPSRVKSALDSLTDGVVMLDRSGLIVLTNDTFCRLTGQALTSLLGKPLARLAWVHEQGQPLMAGEEYPWERAQKSQAPQQGSRLGFRSNDRQWQTFSVTSTPIFDDQGGLRGVVASFHDVTDVDRAHKQLREAIGELERSRTKVISQNQMLEQTNESLQTEIERRKRVQDEREELNRQLIETSRLVGMADVASAVLHNVGNVLNSINVSVEVVMNTVKQSPIGDVALVASMLQSHRHDLPHFLSQDHQGKQIPTYLSMLAETVNQNSMFVERELGGLSRNVDHVRQVVSRQVDLARPGGVIREPVHFQDLMEQALAINRSALENCRCEIREEYEDVPDGITDRHQVIQVLVNLISNAANAMAPSSAPVRRLTVRLAVDSDRAGFVRFQVIDTGVGISQEHAPRLFTQGFTTRPDGHGLGLHSAALVAKQLGGSIQGYSDGEGLGATFTFTLPFESVEVSA